MPTLRLIGVSAVVLSLAVLSPAASLAQSGADLFQQALRRERVGGDVKGAIALYQRILKAHAADRALTAKVLVQLAESYQKLGLADAKATYQRVVRDFADQPEQVAIARARLAVLTQQATVAGRTGVAVRRIWSGADVDLQGTAARDNSYLTFVDQETGDLAVRDLTSGKSRHLTNKGSWVQSQEMAEGSVPSPDGRRIAYSWFNNRYLSDLRVIGLDGSAPHILYPDAEGPVWPHDWTADGKQVLATIERNDRTTQIALISVVDGSLRVIKTLDWRGPGKLSLSPDGRYIAYDIRPKENAPQRDIFVLASDGTRESALVEHPADDFVLGWAPDGKHLLFASDRTGSMSVWVAPVEGGKEAGEPQLVRRDLGRTVPMGFAQNGTYYYGVNASTVDVYVGALDPGTGKVVGTPAKAAEQFVGANSQPDWSRDGSSLVFVRRSRMTMQGPGSRELVIRSMETGKERALSPKLYGYQGPRWSPDGQAIFVTGTDEQNRQGIYRIDTQTSAVTSVGQGVPGERIYLAGLSSEAKSVVYLAFGRSPQNDAYVRIVKRDLESGETRELYRSPTNVNIYFLAVSPSGRDVAFVEYTQPMTLKVLSTAGGEPKEVLRIAKEQQGWFTALDWSADGRALLYAWNPSLTLDSQKASLWRLPLTGGASEELGLTIDGLRDIRVRPDGQRIAITAGRHEKEVWVMENILPKMTEPVRPKKR